MIDVVLLPEFLPREALPEAQVVVLDILRATSTTVTALASGAASVRLFDRPEEVLKARAAAVAPVIVAGERGCRKIAGFDLGNSPAEYSNDIVNKAAIYLSTTNGTRAAVAARTARRMLIGSLLNAAATAEAVVTELDRGPTLLLCAGTDGRTAIEDVIGAGAILWQVLAGTMRPDLELTDTAWIAYQTFASVRSRLAPALRLGQGGINLIHADLEADIDFCAALDRYPLAVGVNLHSLEATPWRNM
ncbi:MAG: 2-phosphosulfolactate phosphatase [Phycisphaerales bacterium]|nr:2-phosphosulfolactate phosphatase [Phycisphaerales bacterium]